MQLTAKRLTGVFSRRKMGYGLVFTIR